MASVSLPQPQPKSQLQQQQLAPSSDAKLQINHASQTAAISANFWLLPTSVFGRANKMKTRKTKKKKNIQKKNNAKISPLRECEIELATQTQTQNSQAATTRRGQLGW